MKVTLEMNNQTYCIETNDIEKIKSFIDCCVELEKQTEKAINELKHW